MDESNMFARGGGSKFGAWLADRENSKRANSLLQGENAGMIGAMGFNANNGGSQPPAPAQGDQGPQEVDQGEGGDAPQTFDSMAKEYQKNKLIDNVVSQDNEKMLGMTQQAGALPSVLKEMPPSAQKLLDKFQQGDLGLQDNIALNGFLNTAIKTHGVLTGQNIEDQQGQKLANDAALAAKNRSAFAATVSGGADVSDANGFLKQFVQNGGNPTTPDVEPFLRSAMASGARISSVEAANERLTDRLNSQKGSYNSVAEAQAALGPNIGKVISKPGGTYDVEIDNSQAKNQNPIQQRVQYGQQLMQAYKAGDYDTAAGLAAGLGMKDMMGNPYTPDSIKSWGSAQGGSGAGAAASAGQPAQSNMVKIRTPSGAVGMIPSQNLQQAIRNGAVQVP